MTTCLEQGGHCRADASCADKNEIHPALQSSRGTGRASSLAAAVRGPTARQGRLEGFEPLNLAFGFVEEIRIAGAPGVGGRRDPPRPVGINTKRRVAMRGCGISRSGSFTFSSPYVRMSRSATRGPHLISPGSRPSRRSIPWQISSSSAGAPIGLDLGHQVDEGALRGSAHGDVSYKLETAPTEMPSAPRRASTALAAKRHSITHVGTDTDVGPGHPAALSIFTDTALTSSAIGGSSFVTSTVAPSTPSIAEMKDATFSATCSRSFASIDRTMSAIPTVAEW